ncbi:MAG TPA: YggU family protein [Lentisphaeria bacterium]|nr:MAG: YggU family protein [Lentisphaerae bacterium GWF2_38_69]HBM14780.1 YggU family protein [Lentisphaeria bacterium]
MENEAFLLTEKNGWVTFKCRVQPGSSKNKIAGLYCDSLKITLNAPPVDGKANEELIKFLAKTLDIPKSSVLIISGLTSRNKSIRCNLSKTKFLSMIKLP